MAKSAQKRLIDSEYFLSRVLNEILKTMPLRLSHDYEFDCFGMNLEYCLVLRDSEPVDINPTAFKILQLLVENRNRIVSTSELNRIWESEETNIEDDSNIQHHISKLKKALGLKPNGEPYIKNFPKGTHRKIGGYQFTGDVRILFKPPSPDKISMAHLPITGSDLFGRDTELQMLDDAWKNPNINIISLVAWGGIGKTALVNHWLKRRMARDHYRGAERVYAWSFHSQGFSEHAASADLFIDQVLRWFGDTDPTQGSPWDKGERLAGLIRQTRTLLVLDGLEPLQHPPGPQERRLKDVALHALLVELAAGQRGLCIISTRERVGDLVEFENNTVIQHDLDYLSPQAGAQVLRALNVKGSDDELEEASSEFKGHAFSLILLGSYLDEVLHGDIRRRKEIENLFDDTRHGDKAQAMLATYEKWLGEGIALAVLRLLGLFDRPADAESIAVLCAAPPIQRLTESLQKVNRSEWQQALSKLRRIKLLGERSPNEPDMLDAHPLVREYFRQQLKRKHPDGWREANNRLYEHLALIAKEFPDTVEEMSPLYAAVSHGCAAGRYQEALDEIYWRRIQREVEHFNWTKLGAFGANFAALSGFFVLPSQEPVTELPESQKAFVLFESGVDLRALGQLQEAAPRLQTSLKTFIAIEKWTIAAINAAYLGQLYMIAGDLRQALEFARQGVGLAERSLDDFWGMAGRIVLADILHQSGHIEKSAAAFQEAYELYPHVVPAHPLLYWVQNYYYLDLLLDQGEVQKVRERAASTLEIAKENNWLINIGLDNLSLGRTWLLDAQQAGTDGIVQAEQFLQSAVDWLRLAAQMEFIPHGLLARAQLYRVKGAYEQAGRDLAVVLNIAKQGGMGLHLADYHLESVRLYLTYGNLAKANEHLELARGMIERMGYHRRDNEINELAEQLH